MTPGGATLRPGARRAVLVLGMHRCGTSALTRAVGLLGAALPKNLMPASAGNLRGFWESSVVAGVNDAILKAGGSNWADWRRFESGRLGAGDYERLEPLMAACIEGEFGHSTLFVLKDPRLSRLLPIWLPMFKRHGIETCALVAFRHPGAVARSLEARDGFSHAFSSLLWLRHLLDAERDTRGIDRAFISFESLLTDWRGALVRAGERVGVDWPNEPSSVSEDFLEDRSTVAETGPEAGSAYADVWCRHVWAALLGFEAGDPGAPALLDRVRGQFEDGCRLFSAGDPARRGRASRPALREVTLCAADSARLALTERALTASAASCDFGAVMLLSDQDPGGSIPVRPIERLASLDDYSAFVIKRLVEHVQTSHVLIAQWDGFVVEPSAWEPGFLAFDYVGARWWWQAAGTDVGNGGFSLRSRRLLDALQDPRFEPQPGVAEDELICRRWRPMLEREFGIRFAPAPVAARFSYEHARTARPSFGFHGLFNFWRHLDDGALAEVVRLLPPDVLEGNGVAELVAQCVLNGRDEASRALITAWERLVPAERVRELLAAVLQRDVSARLSKGLGGAALATPPSRSI